METASPEHHEPACDHHDHDLDRHFCPNDDCPEHGKRGLGNIHVTTTYGKAQTFRMLRCRSCGRRFSERRGTAMFRSRLTDEKIAEVLHHIAEGCGIRQTERLTGVHRDTVMRLVKQAGIHAKATHDERVAFSPLDS